MALADVRRRWPLLLAVAALAAGGGAALAQGGANAPQAPDAETLYGQHCAACHGESLQGQIGPTLNDIAFKQRWSGKAQALADYIHDSMPPGSAGTLPP